MSGRLSLDDQKNIDAKVSNILLATDKTYPEDRLEDIIESYGHINVVETDFKEESDVVLGAVAYPNGNDARIFINKDLSPERKTFTLAHEFGHYIMHGGKEKFRLDFVPYDGSENAKDETEANYFAATLLMPKRRFLEMYDLLHNESLVADYFGVSLAAVRNRKAWIDSN